MRLTQKLLGYIHRIFSKDPDGFLALRIRYDGNMAWEISDGTLTTVVSGGSGSALSINLSDYTLRTLVAFINSQPGYNVPFACSDPELGLSAKVLIDGKNDQGASNGDHLSGYSSLIWSFLEAAAVELNVAKLAIIEMVKQMSVTTASDEWLDEVGSYYNVFRLTGETDALYGPRIIAEVLRPRGNNISIEAAIESATNGFRATVDDSPLTTISTYLRRDGYIHFDGQYRRGLLVRSHYAQFDVNAKFDLLSAESISDLMIRIRAAVEKFRDAGTKMRQVTLSGELSDTTPKQGADTFGYAGTLSLSADQYLPPRSVRNGAILRGNAQRLIYAGTLQRNGSINRIGFRVVGTPPYYQAQLDPVNCAMAFNFADRSTAELTFSGLAERKGTLTRNGERYLGLDSAGITVTRILKRDGRYQRGAPRDGSLRYQQSSRMVKTIRYAGTSVWSEALR